ncbi:conserved hypothetical protein [Histoplasma capsulatum var. duboisii H88]|uniref:Transcription factor domain-containing protein n=1 Tax=Ajellomyces capsulatus (strain H88) TaxID=544711 RepID=F0U9I7_AJEC8|nr:conserved hypothetical protein [Histoplasma capsulatum var. duboisii H88]
MYSQRGQKRYRLNEVPSPSCGPSHIKKPSGIRYHRQEDNNEDQEEDQGLWDDRSMFAIDMPDIGLLPLPDEQSTWHNNYMTSALDISTWQPPTPSFLSDAQLNHDFDTAARDWLQQVLFPDMPSLEDRFISLSLSNPYSDNAPSRHETLRTQILTPEDGSVNGYIKFRIRNAELDESSNKSAKRSFGASFLGVHHRSTTEANSMFDNIPYLPPNFASGVKLDAVDGKLLKFFAYCQGRTLLSQTNFWLTEIASMIATEDAVKHAILALVGGYVLDYVHKDDLRKRTNAHYRKATELITAGLARPEAHAVSKSEGIVAAILLLLVDDCVNWELRKPKGETPNWYKGAHLAKAILDHSDPGYRYWKVTNVQCDKAWLANANWASLACVLAEPVTPLQLRENDRRFGWLLEGTERENPHSIVTPIGALKIEEMLHDFRQRSELSEGYATTDALLESCILDVDGKVNTATKVTELTGETWVWAAKIYLHCRFFRKPRCHPDVCAALKTLMTCVQRMPYNGALFTSQAPFFCVFIMSLVSYQQHDRDVARNWFETVLLAASCRSSVPPVWEAVQVLWEWMDAELVDEDNFDNAVPIGERRAWWEDMVAYLLDKVGWLL